MIVFCFLDFCVEKNILSLVEVEHLAQMSAIRFMFGQNWNAETPARTPIFSCSKNTLMLVFMGKKERTPARAL